MNETINESISQVSNQIPVLLGNQLPFTFSPILDIFLISLLGALFTTLVNKYLSDQVAIKALRKEMKSLQKKARAAIKEDPKKAQKYQSEIMKKNLENMRHSMNPKILLTTMIPMLLLFLFIKQHYSGFGEFLDLGFNVLWLPWGWLGTYIFFSIINSIILKKILDVA